MRLHAAVKNRLLRVFPWQAQSVFTTNPRCIVRVFRGSAIGTAFCDDLSQTRNMQLGRKIVFLLFCRDRLRHASFRGRHSQYLLRILDELEEC